MKVSFLIPAYNAGTTLSRAIDSILNQHPSDLDYEIIIADDGSNDNTKEIAKNMLMNMKTLNISSKKMKDYQQLEIS